MKLIRKLFPYSFIQKKNVLSLILNVVVYLIVGNVLGYIIGFISTFPFGGYVAGVPTGVLSFIPGFREIFSILVAIINLYMYAGMAFSILDHFKVFKQADK